MTSVVVAKKKPKYGFMPLTNMWWAHTTTDSTPIARIAHTMVR